VKYYARGGEKSLPGRGSGRNFLEIAAAALKAQRGSERVHPRNSQCFRAKESGFHGRLEPRIKAHYDFV
jgi:hypothetical protein